MDGWRSYNNKLSIPVGNYRIKVWLNDEDITGLSGSCVTMTDGTKQTKWQNISRNGLFSLEQGSIGISTIRVDIPAGTYDNAILKIQISPVLDLEDYVEYKNNRLSRINSIYVYLNYLSKEVNSEEINNIIENIIYSVINRKLVDNNTKISIKSISNKYELYAYGISGRENFNDLYGGYSRYVSSSLCGRSPNYTEITATLMARFIAKNIVAAGLIDKVEIGLNYESGMLEPNSIIVNSYGQQFDSGLINSNDIIIMIKKVFPLKILEIINFFELRKLDYFEVSKYGYFTNEDFPWEKINYAKIIKEYFTKEKGMIFLNY